MRSPTQTNATGNCKSAKSPPSSKASKASNSQPPGIPKGGAHNAFASKDPPFRITTHPADWASGSLRPVQTGRVMQAASIHALQSDAPASRDQGASVVSPRRERALCPDPRRHRRILSRVRSQGCIT